MKKLTIGKRAGEEKNAVRNVALKRRKESITSPATESHGEYSMIIVLLAGHTGSGL